MNTAIQSAMNQQNTFNERFQKALEAAPFPCEIIKVPTGVPSWFDHAHNALRFASIIGLGINPNDWQGLLSATGKKEMSLYQFAILSNNLQARTPNDLSLNLLEYYLLMDEADTYVVKWQELSNGIRAEIEASLEEEMKMRQASAQTPKPNGMQAVKGEA